MATAAPAGAAGEEGGMIDIPDQDDADSGLLLEMAFQA